MKLNLSTIGSGYGATSALNANFDAIEGAIENTLSRDGTTPNEMNANIDMNDNSILNVNALDVESLTIAGIPVSPDLGVTVVSAFQTHSFIATTNQTSFSVAPFTPYVASVQVEVNGLSLPPADIAVSGTNVVIPACSAGDEVVIRRYTNAPSPFPNASDISFNQVGTIQTRTVQSKLRESVSVTDFGAVGDGFTDDTVAIQAALDAALRVDFGDRSKNYKVSGTLIVRSYSTLEFNGARIFQVSRQTALLNANNTTGVSIQGGRFTGYPAVDVTAGNFVVGVPYTIRTPGTTNFVALGAADNNVGTYFIAAAAGSGTGVASTFYNRPISQDIAILATGASNLSVIQNEFNGFNYSGLMVASGGNNISFENNIVVGPGASTLTTNYRNNTGVTIVNTNGVRIVNNTFSDVSQGLIVGQQSSNVVVANNIIKNTIVEHGMYLDTGLVNTVVTGNTLNDCAAIGIKFQWYDAYVPRTQPKNLTISDNVINGSATGDGILVLNVATNPIANVIGITNANPGVISFDTAHGLSVGDAIELVGVNGMTPLNGQFYVNSVVSSTSITIRTSGSAIDTTNVVNYPPYTSGGNLRKPLYLDGLTISGNVVKNCLQDGISIRYVDGAVISGNHINGCGRYGYGQIAGLNVSFNSNNITNTQFNGIFADMPLAPCTFTSNILTNVGVAGIDTSGGSSGLYVQGDGGGSVTENDIRGERTRTKMLYGIQLASGDKSQYVISDNVISDAESAIVSLHNLTSVPLKLFDRNIGTAASGADALVGLPTALPCRGNPSEWYWGNTFPTTGTWQQGNRVWNLYPLGGDPSGWVCLVSGTPGTWVPFGAVRGLNAYTVTNPTTDRSLNVTADTIAQVAAVLGTLIADLKTAGVLL